jgi:hypothetical protein
MVIVSGLVLDFNTDIGISGALISVYTNNSLYSSTLCAVNGYYEVSVPASGYVTYSPVLNNYIGYTRTLPYNIPFTVLYMRNVAGQANPSISGNTINAFPATLVTSTNIRDFAFTRTNCYIATDGGLDILDLNTYQNVGYIPYSGGFTAIAVNSGYPFNTRLLLGTATSGVMQFSIPAVYPGGSTNLALQLVQRYSVERGNLVSNNVQCISINNGNDVLVGSVSGIDLFILNNRYYTNYGNAVGTSCCYVTDYDAIYYSPVGSGLYVNYTPPSGGGLLPAPSYTITLSGTGVNPFPLLSNYINKIVVTSVSGVALNPVFLATQSGLMYYTENANLNISASGATLVRSFP